MKILSVICDRCRAPSIENQSIIEATAGPLRGRYPEKLDLCATCSDRFSEWLRSSHGEAATLPDDQPTAPAPERHSGRTRAVCQLAASG